MTGEKEGVIVAISRYRAPIQRRREEEKKKGCLINILGRNTLVHWLCRMMKCMRECRGGLEFEVEGEVCEIDASAA